MRAAIDDWGDVLAMPDTRLRELIRPAGLPDQKGRAIRSAIERLSEEGDPARVLDTRLAGSSDREGIAFLSSFPGVGVKTAACVLCFALRRPILPVDTHVRRLAVRLGWVPPGASATKAHEELEKRVPEALRFALHVHLIELGRDVCKARNPDCARCPLRDICPRVGVAA